jgi:signal transduction histidine kinase
VIVAIAIAAAAAVVLVPSARFEIVSPATSPVLIAGCSAAALYVAYLAAQRFAREARAAHFGIAVSLGLVGLADMVFVLERGTLAPDASTAASLLVYHLAGALVLAASVVFPLPGVVRKTARLSTISAIATLGLLLLLLSDAGALSAAGMATSDVQNMTEWRIATCAALVVAAAALASERRVRDEALLRWVAVATLLMAAAQAARAAEPVTRAATVTWSHVFYAAVMLALLAGAFAEARRRRWEAARLAAADERRRVARDIHDGPAQDMAFVASQTWQLARVSGDERLREIALAAERALDDSRAVVGQITHAREESLEVSLTRLARACRDRWGLHVGVALECSLELERWQEQEVIAIVREALSNAARHSQAERADVRLGYRRGVLTLTVTDNGRGFDTEAVRRAGVGFGLHTMAERAQRMGGDVHLESASGRGTTIQVPIP